MAAIDYADKTGFAHPVKPGGRLQIFTRTLARFNRAHISSAAASSAFFVLLSLVPALAAFVTLYGLIFDASDVVNQLRGLSGWLPDESRSLIEDQLRLVVSRPASSLGIALVASLGLSLWSASSATKSIFEGLNLAYEQSETRSFAKYNLTALGLTLAGLITVIATLAVSLVLPAVITILLPFTNPWVVQAASIAAVLAASWLVLLAFYRWGPALQPASWRSLLPGSAVALIGLVALTAAFSFYAGYFAGYSAYGSLGSVIGFMTWIWLSLIALLAGATVNAELSQSGTDGSKEGQSPAVNSNRGGADPTSNRPKEDVGGTAGQSAAIIGALALVVALIARRN